MQGAVCLAAVLGLAATARAAEAWTRFTARESGFSISAPGVLRYEKQTTPTRLGTLALHNYSLTREHDTITYFVSRTDYPDSVRKANAPDRLLDLARDGQISGLRAKVISETRLNVSGFPGRELRFTTGHGLRGRLRLVMAKARLYQVLGLSTPAQASRADLKRFITSFRLN